MLLFSLYWSNGRPLLCNSAMEIIRLLALAGN